MSVYRQERLIKWFENLINFNLVLIYFFKTIRNPRELIQRKAISNKLVIIGTGPSVNSDINNLLSDRDRNHYMVLNSLALSDLFLSLRPEYYVFVDPLFFTPFKERTNKVDSTIKRISTEVNWPMKLIVPKRYSKSSTISELRENKCISFEFFSYKPIIGGTMGVSANLFSLGLASPHFKNVLVASIYYGILLGYRNLNIFGADHSWHEEMRLNNNKTLEISDRQFYSGDVNWIVQNENKDKSLRPKVKLKRISEVLESYDYLELYAKKRNVEIRNLSSKSWIDNFKNS